MKTFLFAVAIVALCDAAAISKRDAQSPLVWDALKQLRGGKDLTVQEQQDLLTNAVAGKDFPINAVIPDTAVDCKQYKQPGFYADDSDPSKCQIFHRCDENGDAKSFLCPNETLFNQITLVCDWFYNIDCSVSKNFVDYSNSRLADPNAKLLDDEMVIAATGADTSLPVAKPAKPAAVKAGKKAGRSEEGSAGSEQSITPAPTEVTTQAAADTTAAAGDTTAASGDTTAASGDTTAASGDTTAASGDTTTAAGDTTAASGDTTPAAGDTTAASGDTTTAAGDTTTAAGDTTTASS